MDKDKAIKSVKMCKNPDRICLQGGCLFCDAGKFQSVKSLKKYAIKNDMLDDFEYGLRQGWPNLTIFRDPT